MIDHMTTSMTLPAAAPFDFSHSLGFLRGFPATQGEQRTAAGELVKVLRVEGRTALARLEAAPDGVSGLHCRLDSDGPLDSRTVSAVGARIGFYLSLDDDLTEFYARGADDPAFAPVIGRLHGYHQVKFPSPLENLVWAILVQRTPMPVAAQAKRALADVFANRLTVDGVEHTAFPDLDQLTSLSPARLAELVGNERKARYLHGALRGWAEAGEPFLRTAAYDQVEEFLRGLPGIGPWSASFILIRGLGRIERAPIDESLRRSVASVYGESPTDAGLRALAARYGAWQGYWAHYLRAVS